MATQFSPQLFAHTTLFQNSFFPLCNISEVITLPGLKHPSSFFSTTSPATPVNLTIVQALSIEMIQLQLQFLIVATSDLAQLFTHLHF